jgi:hypothetical protein
MKARAYAYGGSIIQDLGYYPLSSKKFSDMVHYVRGGDFVMELVNQAANLNEYAFAIGAVAHYSADISGHTIATNRAVAMLYPKKRAKFGDEITYEQYPSGHLQTEFCFDVLEVASGSYAPNAFHDFIGFEVSKPLLERAFRATYGIELKEVFKSVDLALGTYRFTISKLIPEMTKVAIATREDQLKRNSATYSRNKFVFRYSRQEFEKEFGKTYDKPGFFARVLAVLFRLIPKVGPFRPLAFKKPTPEVDKLFVQSFEAAAIRYRSLLAELSRGTLQAKNVNLDTGKPVRAGEYHLADAAYDALAEKLAKIKPEDVPPAMRTDILTFYKGHPPQSPAVAKALSFIGQ